MVGTSDPQRMYKHFIQSIQSIDYAMEMYIMYL